MRASDPKSVHGHRLAAPRPTLWLPLLLALLASLPVMVLGLLFLAP